MVCSHFQQWHISDTQDECAKDQLRNGNQSFITPVALSVDFTKVGLIISQPKGIVHPQIFI